MKQLTRSTVLLRMRAATRRWIYCLLSADFLLVTWELLKYHLERHQGQGQAMKGDTLLKGQLESFTALNSLPDTPFTNL
jgi:hypothetical protein